MFSASCTALLSALGSTWLPVLVDAAAKGTAVLVVACIAGLFVRRASAATRHLVWFLAMVSLLALPGLSMVLPGWQGPRVCRAPSEDGLASAGRAVQPGRRHCAGAAVETGGAPAGYPRRQTQPARRDPGGRAGGYHKCR